VYLFSQSNITTLFKAYQNLFTIVNKKTAIQAVTVKAYEIVSTN